MKYSVASSGILLLFALAGCGGGGGVPPAVRPDTVPATTPEPVPLLDSRFDCDSLAPVATTHMSTFPNGVWQGTLVDCGSDTSEEVRAYVSEDGRFRILSANPQRNADLLRGTLETDGDAFAGEGLYFDAEGWATRLGIDGLIQAESQLDGRWWADWGGYGYFALTFEAGQSHSPIPLAEWPAEWAVSKEGTATAAEVSWTIETDGRVSGQDTAGCIYQGQFGVAVPQHFYELELTLSSCALEGSYLGLGQPTAGPFNDRLYVSVDDGERLALGMLFLSK